MRILEIGMTKNIGGIQTFLMNFNRHIDKDEVKIDYLCIYPDEKILYFYNEIQSLGARIVKTANYQKNFLKSYFEIKKLIEKEHYDVVHYNMNSACYLIPLIAAKHAGAKIIISHAHNASSDKGWLKDLVHTVNKHFIPRYANLFFACSDKAGQYFFSEKIMESKHYYFIPNAIDMGKYAYNKEIGDAKRKELGIGDELVFGNVGRLSKQKNHEYLMKEFLEIKAIHPHSKLLLVGHGPLKETVEKMVADLGLERDVLILSFRSDVDQLLQAMDCFIMPSLYEGLPVVGIEAQASGLPCFFSDMITTQLKISDKARFFSLDDNIKENARRAIEACAEERQESSIINPKNRIFDSACSSSFIVGILKENLHEESGL